MSVFTGPLVIEEIVPGRLWRLRAPIRYALGMPPKAEADAAFSGGALGVDADFEKRGHHDQI